MKKVKIFLVLMLVLLLTVPTMVTVYADTIYNYGSWSFTLDDSGAFEVYSCALTASEITVPVCVDWYEVRSIGYGAFWGNKTLTSITIREPVNAIGDYAFAECPLLEQVWIPESVSSIGADAFFHSPDVTIYCTLKSYALQYAKAHNIPYVLTDVPAYIRGDADSDGKVLVFDVTTIQRRLVSLNVENAKAVERNGDVNGDGLNILDATWIQRWLAQITVPYAIGETVYEIPTETADEYELPVV